MTLKVFVSAVCFALETTRSEGSALTSFLGLRAVTLILILSYHILSINFVQLYEYHHPRLNIRNLNMYLLTSLLLSLSAGALAYATNTTSTNNLGKRATYGWITNYAPDDTDCKRGYNTDFRPELYDTCIKWTPSTNNIGVNFGTWPDVCTDVKVYSDGDCKNVIATINPDKGRAMGPTRHANHGPNVCYHIDAKKVGSVMGFLKE